MHNKVQKWYDTSYRISGFGAQRYYPNEELLRFLGRYFFNQIDFSKRNNIKILEIGCGSCANLWMVAKEGFDAYGLDISPASLNLGKKMLDKWGVSAKLKEGSFLDLPYENNSFDVIIDVFSMNCVNHNDFLLGLTEVYRTLKKQGRFFSYTPSQNSDAFQNHYPAKKIDDYTLNGIYRKSSPYAGNHYPFHFWNKMDYQNALIKEGFNIDYFESLSKSFSKEKEKFEHFVVYSRK